ncbi:Origin recognition complex subunit 2 [Gurleya vavrai]
MLKFSSNLEKFHYDCKNEFTETLQYFNILFYGYGCKEKLLKKIFPDFFILNCYCYKTEEIIEEIINHAKSKFKIKKVKKDFFDHLDLFLYKKNKEFTVILINFDFSLDILKNRKRIKLIATLEKIFTPVERNFLKEFNFIFRDLTTFESYKTEIQDINLKKNDMLCISCSVLENVSKRTKNIFLCLIEEFCEENVVDNNEFLIKVGKKFFIKQLSVLNQLLVEFYDHKILKKKSENEFFINLSKMEKIKLIQMFKINKS